MRSMHRKHVLLLGDSTLDNKAYVPPGEHVGLHLAQLGHRVLDVSRDGARTHDILTQAHRARRLLEETAEAGDAVDVVLSVGGNDALGDLYALALPAETVAAGVLALAERVHGFQNAYRSAVESALVGAARPRHRLRRLVLCTLYRPPYIGEAARLAAGLYNDAIARIAYAFGAALDCRVVQLGDELDDDDYLGIEPGATASAKIAQALHAALGD